MRCWIFRVQLQRLLEITLRTGPVPIVREFHKSARCISLSQIRICIDSFLCSGLGLWHFVNRSYDSDIAKQGVRICKSGESESERRVPFFGSFEIVDAVSKTFFVPFVPEVTPF